MKLSVTFLRIVFNRKNTQKEKKGRNIRKEKYTQIITNMENFMQINH